MRLIDADPLRENMKSVCMGVMAGTEPYTAPLAEIDNAPTIEERKVGKWIRWHVKNETKKYYEYIPHAKCSECGEEYDPFFTLFINYCPNCGTYMAGRVSK